MVEVLRESRQLEAAGDRLQHLREHHPDNVQILMQIGLVERQRGHRKAALEWFRSAYAIAKASLPNALANEINTQISDIPPSIVVPLSQIQGFVIEELRELGQFEQAQTEIEQSFPQVKKQVRTQLLLGSILQQTLKIEAASKVYSTILDTHPNHVVARVELARTLSQRGQTSVAIELLEQTHDQLGPQIQVLLLLGNLYHAIEDWEQAQHCFEGAYRDCANAPLAHCAYAEWLYRQGRIQQAFTILMDAQQTFPTSVDISLKLVTLAQHWGDVELAQSAYKTVEQSHRYSIPLKLHYCRFQIRCGDLDGAIATLSTITTDHHHWCKQIAQLRGEIALHQSDFDTAEAQYRRAMDYQPPTPHERNQLARILLLKGRVDEAYRQIELATDSLEDKTPAGKVNLPIKNHVATLINEFRLNPPMMAQLQTIQHEMGHDRLLALGSLLLEDPSFLGTTIFLSKELREQGIFEQLKKVLSNTSTTTTDIPKSIMQFWDHPQPPDDVCALGQTWIDYNPDYTYKRFSLREAIAFLKHHYDDDVLQAFRLCRHPAAQADLFRLAYLNKMGGFYADADDRCCQSLELLRKVQAELILYQEDFACFGNNFLGSVPGQPVIRSALYQAVENLLNYSAEWAWSQTGPGLLTSSVCSGLLPYLAFSDYRMWPRLWVMTRGELTSFVWIHVQLAYKGTEKSWQSHAYPKTKLSPRPVHSIANEADKADGETDRQSTL